MKSPLSIFVKSSNSFDGEEKDEKVILLVRKHPFFIIIRLVFLAILLLIPAIVGAKFSPFLYSHGLLALASFALSIWALIIWSGAFYSLTMYTLNIWIVTDRRIIDSTQQGFFSRTVSELHMTRIQDISVETKGVIQTLLKFGDLQVQTAGKEDRFRFSQIPHPERVKDEIMKLAHFHPTQTPTFP